MAPGRPLKRQKTNPTEQSLPSEVARPTQIPLPETPPSIPEPRLGHSPPKDISLSWYNRTWPRKAAAVTQVARESVSTSKDAAAAEIASIIKDKTTDKKGSIRSPSLAMALGKSKANRSLPIDATTTKIHATPEATSPSRTSLISVESKKADTAGEEGKKSVIVEELPKEGGNNVVANKANAAGIQDQVGKQEVDTVGQVSNSGWLGWLSASNQPQPAATGDDASDVSQNVAKVEEAKDRPRIVEPAETSAKSVEQENAQDTEPSTSSNKRSWLQMWGTDSTDRPSTPKSNQLASEQAETPQPKSNILKIPETPSKSTSQLQASSIETSPPPPLPGDATRSSGWVFWSREKKDGTTASSDTQPHVGEIAISDTPSQARPKRASLNLVDQKSGSVAKVVGEQAHAKQKTSSKAESINKVEMQQPAPKEDKKGHTKQDSKTIKAESSNAAAVVKEPGEAITPRNASPAPSKVSKKVSENLLLPSFRETLRPQEDLSLLQQLARLWFNNREDEFKHLSIVKEPPKLKNALAIGVHGYFPAPLIRSVLGQPTGTSIKFADMAAKSIKKWTRSRGYDCQVKTAALEGEGKISERIELLWKLLLNWIDEIRKSDFVMVACHSQGVPVAIMLVAKLVQFGCVSAARVGICAMAGVNMGPFGEYKSRWISGSAGELFEFSDPGSKVSEDYYAAMEVILKFGVRLSFIGSIDDQLVSLESSTFSPVTHPHIYRAVSIDARLHAPNFLSHLVGFALKLRNLGVQDHGLIRELSSPLAGSLYTGEGHSRIYEDDAVYDLAVAFALETNSLPNVQPHKKVVSASAGNPYILPFAMRGILEEEFVKNELQSEVVELLKQFDDWRPTTKVLKDVKFRLEGIRSKL